MRIFKKARPSSSSSFYCRLNWQLFFHQPTLCCSTNFVSNNIFDEETALYLKMSLYLPIKVFKNDRLPQKICDKCSCKVNDFYQFCNETIEVQSRLRAALLISNQDTEPEYTVDLTLIKESADSPLQPPIPPPSPHTVPKPHFIQPTVFPSVQPNLDIISSYLPVSNNSNLIQLSNSKMLTDPSNLKDQSTQTEIVGSIENPPKAVPSDIKIKVKVEAMDPPSPLPNIKCEASPGSDSDDVLLVNLRKKKTKRKSKSKENGVPKKRGRKPVFETIMNDIAQGSVSEEAAAAGLVKQEVSEGELSDYFDKQNTRLKIKTEEDIRGYFCCMCMLECDTRVQLLQHYEMHANEIDLTRKFEAPEMPTEGPLRCNRCSKSLSAAEWVSHWARHWERDRRALRCALCRRTFRKPLHILNHGYKHSRAEALAPAGAGDDGRRFGCDMCDLTFPYMREVLAHRTVAHPCALGRALDLRCGECSRTFRHLNSLRRHLRAHSGVREHLCNVCGKALSSREHLKFHIRIHTGYKPNVCKVCGKGFVKKCNLTLHERVHSGEKPHVCATCGKAFSQRSTLVIHERYHSGARPYVCLLCGRGFVARGLLSMHLKSTCV